MSFKCRKSHPAASFKVSSTTEASLFKDGVNLNAPHTMLQFGEYESHPGDLKHNIRLENMTAVLLHAFKYIYVNFLSSDRIH